jgi:hypothetical protein
MMGPGPGYRGGSGGDLSIEDNAPSVNQDAGGADAGPGAHVADFTINYNGAGAAPWSISAIAFR